MSRMTVICVTHLHHICTIISHLLKKPQFTLPVTRGNKDLRRLYVSNWRAAITNCLGQEGADFLMMPEKREQKWLSSVEVEGNKVSDTPEMTYVYMYRSSTICRNTIHYAKVSKTEITCALSLIQIKFLKKSVQSKIQGLFQSPCRLLVSSYNPLTPSSVSHTHTDRYERRVMQWMQWS